MAQNPKYGFTGKTTAAAPKHEETKPTPRPQSPEPAPKAPSPTPSTPSAPSSASPAPGTVTPSPTAAPDKKAERQEKREDREKAAAAVAIAVPSPLPGTGNPEQIEADRRMSENRADERAARAERKAERAERKADKLEGRYTGVTQGDSATRPISGAVEDPNNPHRVRKSSPYKPIGGVQEAEDGTMINRPFGSEPQVAGGSPLLKGRPVPA